jgi:hypothetical protein
MRTLLLPCVAAAVVLGPAAHGRAAGDPRAIVARAVQAEGGEEKLSQDAAVHSRIKGKISQLDGAGFTGEVWTQAHDQFKNVIRVEGGGQKITLTQVLRGDKGWMDINGMVQDLDAATLADMKTSAYHDRVMGLVALLKDKSFKLTAVGPVTTADKRKAVGVKVSSAGHPDVTLAFDPATGLLIGSEYRAKKDALMKEVTTAVTLSDYRAIDPAADDERALKEARLPADGKGLLEVLRRQVRSEADRARVKGLIKRLADESFQEREKAQEELIRLGGVAVPQLREAAREDNEDPEVASRARKCLEKMPEKVEEARRQEAAVGPALRLVALRKPDGAAEVLLALAPSLTEEGLARELRAALAAVAVRDGKPDKAVEQALEDKDPARRAAAAAALGHDGGAYARQPGRRLFLTGLKRPMKVCHYQDGEKQAEWELVDVQYFNKFDNSLFARPR